MYVFIFTTLLFDKVEYFFERHLIKFSSLIKRGQERVEQRKGEKISIFLQIYMS